MAETVKSRLQELFPTTYNTPGWAWYRIVGNSTLIGAELIPEALLVLGLPGEAASVAADIAKYIVRYNTWTRIHAPWLDLTPDVHEGIAGFTEFLEIPFGIIPTHAIEGGIQIAKDIRRLRNNDFPQPRLSP